MSLKITDLSVGDWVSIDGEPRKINSINGISGIVSFNGLGNYYGTGVIEPIPITPELLEKNGFNKNGEYNEWNIGTWRTPYLLGVSLERPAITIKWNGSSVFIDQAKYVHELQHALRLVGNTRKIEI
jgi:hypothetical protein